MTLDDDCRYWCDVCEAETPEDDVNSSPDDVYRCNSCYIDMRLASTLKYPTCGLNADWCVQAWYLDGPWSEANLTSGGTYLLDNEDGTYLILKRYYECDGHATSSGNDLIVELLTLTASELVGLIDSGTLEQRIKGGAA